MIIFLHLKNKSLNEKQKIEIKLHPKQQYL